ncbi:MAG TPA: alginate lyase family protein [Candidatus Sulfopaludibacter sp.]|nr:alginate lyase family protein [Candidatus Sulfopaludibacter sp.]
MKRVTGLFLIAFVVQAADNPVTLVSGDEAEPIHSAIIRREAWTMDAVRRLRADAEKRLKEGPWSVTAERPKSLELDLDVHDYYSQAPYWWPDPTNATGTYVRKDGQVNPDRFMSNKNALNAMGEAVFTLGTAAFLLDDTRYAQRAARDINTWFVNPKTRMNPSMEFAQVIRGSNDNPGGGILEGRIFIRAIQGMEFLSHTGAWDPKDQAAVHKWFEEYLAWLTHSQSGLHEKNSGNNHASWWTAQVAAVATFVGDKAEETAAFNYYRQHILPAQIRADGSAPREEARTRSLSYSAFNLEAFSTICRIAQVNGEDLWSVQGRRGASITTIVEYLRPYLQDPKRWSKEQIIEFQNDGLYSLAFTGMGLKNPQYVALYKKLERPEGSPFLSLVDLLVGRWEAAAHQTRH